MEPFTFTIEALSDKDLAQLRANVAYPILNGIVDSDPIRRAAALDVLDVETDRRNIS